MTNRKSINLCKLGVNKGVKFIDERQMVTIFVPGQCGIILLCELEDNATQKNRIIEWFGLEGTFKDHLV